MPYITNKKRAHLAKQTTQSYTLRKVFISITVVSLIVLVVFAILAIWDYATIVQQFQGEKADVAARELIWKLAHSSFPLFAVSGESAEAFEVTGLSGFGWFMAVWAVVTCGLSIASLVLMLTMRSPKATKKGISTMQGAALSGKKLGKNATQIYRERATNPKKLKKGKVSK